MNFSRVLKKNSYVHGAYIVVIVEHSRAHELYFEFVISFLTLGNISLISISLTTGNCEVFVCMVEQFLKRIFNGLTLSMEFISRVRLYFWYFRRTSENIKNQTRLLSDINSILNVKSIEIPGYFIYFCVWTCLFRLLDTACNPWRGVTTVCYFSQCEKHVSCFHSVKITASENITFIQWTKSGIICNKYIYNMTKGTLNDYQRL